MNVQNFRIITKCFSEFRKNYHHLSLGTFRKPFQNFDRGWDKNEKCGIFPEEFFYSRIISQSLLEIIFIRFFGCQSFFRVRNK